MARRGSETTGQKIRLVLSFFVAAAVMIVSSSFQQALKFKDFHALDHAVVSSLLADENRGDNLNNNAKPDDVATQTVPKPTFHVANPDRVVQNNDREKPKRPSTPRSPPKTLPMEVQHAWVEATFTNLTKLPESKRFYMFDAYRTRLPSGYDPSTSPEVLSLDEVSKQAWVEYTMIMGEGVAGGVSFHNQNKAYQSDLLCHWSETHTTTKARIQFMRAKDGTIHYRPDAVDMPFSRVDAYMTQYIFCETPPNSPNARLVALKSSLADWVLNVENTTPVRLLENEGVRQIQDGGVVAPTTGRFAACVAPVYGGFKNLRWTIEYLEYLRAVGADWVHFPLFDDEQREAQIWNMLRTSYNASDFLRIHHWSDRQSKGLSSYKKAYEHSKYLAWNDCYLRGRGQVDYVVFIDIDELPVSPNFGQDIGEALKWCDTEFTTNGTVGFSIRSVTVTSIFKFVANYSDTHTLILDEYNYTEMEPMFKKHNYGKYHSGRAKYFARTREVDRIMPFMTWTHAFSRDYEFSDRFMTLVPLEILNVRHYTSAWWYVNHDVTPKRLVDGEAANRNYNASIARSILNQMEQQIIGDNPILKEYYQSFTSKKAVAWANPMIFPNKTDKGA